MENNSINLRDVSHDSFTKEAKIEAFFSIMSRFDNGVQQYGNNPIAA